MINPLITSPSPRDIPDFIESQRTIPCDKLLVKYHHAKRAYKIMRSYFLEHTEYTHLILHPDDLIANKTHYEAIKHDIEQYDYQVLSGICPVDSLDRSHLLACTIDKMPSMVRKIGSYNFVKKEQGINEILEVQWAGFPFMWIRRDVMEKIEFEDDTRWNPKKPNMGWGFDTAFCYNCHELGIPIHVDFRVMMEHKKRDYKIEGHTIRTGHTDPKIILIHDNIEYDITKECNEKYLSKEDWTKYPHMNTTLRTTDYV